MAFGVADDNGDITTNGIVTGTLTAVMSLLLLGFSLRVRFVSFTNYYTIIMTI